MSVLPIKRRRTLRKFWAIGKYTKKGEWRVLVDIDTNQLLVFDDEISAHATLENVSVTHDTHNYLVKEVPRPEPPKE